MIKVNDLVYYAQLEMFDTELVGKEGIVVFIDQSRKEPLSATARVLFTGLGKKTVPIHCLELVK